MTDQFIHRAKRLLVLAMVTPLLFLIVYYGAPTLSSQTRHLRAIESHIEKIAPQWNKFRAEHSGFENVRLFAYTDGDGMFGANGHVATHEHMLELRKFMESTSPPRPVYVGSIRVVGPGFFEFQKNSEEAVPTNGSPPVRLETNSTPSSTGFRR